MTNKSVLEFLPNFVLCVLLTLLFTEIAIPEHIINGEFVYTAGFVIILYIIWGETYSFGQTVFRSQFGFNEFSVFWSNYKEIEYYVLTLIRLKLTIVEKLLTLFLMLNVIFKVLSLARIDFLNYKVSFQLLNTVKLKIKSLPLLQ